MEILKTYKNWWLALTILSFIIPTFFSKSIPGILGYGIGLLIFPFIICAIIKSILLIFKIKFRDKQFLISFISIWLIFIIAQFAIKFHD